MADQWGNLSWYSPDPRAVLEHENIHISRTLRARLRQGRYEIRFDSAFEQVMRACAAPRSGEPGTWIDQSFVRVYTRLHQFGFAHSAEAWEDGNLAGGLYGVANALDAANASGAEGGSVHHKGVELNAAVAIEKAATSSVEGFVFFHDDDGGFDGVKRRAAFGERGPASV